MSSKGTLSKLLCSVKEVLKYQINLKRVLRWSDSEVASYWIKRPTKRM